MQHADFIEHEKLTVPGIAWEVSGNTVCRPPTFTSLNSKLRAHDQDAHKTIADWKLEHQVENRPKSLFGDRRLLIVTSGSRVFHQLFGGVVVRSLSWILMAKSKISFSKAVGVR